MHAATRRPRQTPAPTPPAPTLQINDDARALVALLIACGIKKLEIAKAMGLDPSWFSRWLRDATRLSGGRYVIDVNQWERLELFLVSVQTRLTGGVVSNARRVVMGLAAQLHEDDVPAADALLRGMVNARRAPARALLPAAGAGRTGVKRAAPRFAPVRAKRSSSG